jgi:transposase-like protein
MINPSSAQKSKIILSANGCSWVPQPRTSTEKKELAELRRRNKQLEMENDILKRAAAYFARENVLPK